MKTKLTPEEIDQEHQEHRMTFKDFQMKFVKDFGKLKEGEDVLGFLFTSFQFQKKIRPLLVLGTHSRWKPYLKAKLKKKEKEFAIVKATFQEGKPKGILNIELVNGKAKIAHIEKAFNKHSPMSGLQFTFTSAEQGDEEVDTTELEDLLKDDKDGYKFGFGKTGFAEIKEQIGTLKTLNDAGEKVAALQALIPKCKTWIEKHSKGGKISKDDVKRVEHIAAAVPKLEKLLDNLLKEINHAGEDDTDYLLGLYKEIVIEYSNYTKERSTVPYEEQLVDLHSIKEDSDNWLSKHTADDLTKKEQKQKTTIEKVKKDLEKRIYWLNAQQELGDDLDDWKRIQKDRKKLDKIPEKNRVERLKAITTLKSRMDKLKVNLS